MPGHNFKVPGLIRAGFQYQDLVAIETLIDFYRDPQRYDWVKLDAEDRAYRSIDDVVACRADGLYELTQVKFAADPAAATSRLSWEWLLEHRPKGRSLLQKWAATTAEHRAAGTLARAVLKTDRAPDAEFGQCLTGVRIDWGNVPPAVQRQVSDQLGSLEAAKAFFADFEFLHSLPHLDDLEEQLWSRIASDTDRGGWSLFRDQVERWSTRKNQPHPDGRIRYIHLRQAFAAERPRPIPQDFLVPAGYQPPDEAFDKKFRAEAFGADGLEVLWGPPGRGKSTYLSHCVAKASRRKTVCIRHHYFLSLDDRSEGRFHFHAISQSLQHQLRDAIPGFPTDSGELGDRLALAADMLAQENRRLVVVVDGLDHVWREHRDRHDMEELFAVLLPLPPNVSLVVGTQRIDPRELPTQLLKVTPVEDWRELPLMSPDAVRDWLTNQDEAGRLNLSGFNGDHRARMFREVAVALHEVSQGLPLHLIYSFESLLRTGDPIDAGDVRALPACPSGDIRDYYRAFWERGSAKTRAILHVLAGLAFGPPPSALHDCFGRSDEAMAAFAEVSHLLELRETGVRPFHGSLFAFARDLPDHDHLFRTHAPDVLSWLRGPNAGYWQWAWRWITERQLGDAKSLIEKTTRSWAIEGLTAGYPLDQVTTILHHAERAAFDVLDLERLLAIRSLRIRALNAPEFQMQEWHLIPEAAISLAVEPTPHALMRTDLVNTPTALMPFVARTSVASIRERVVSSAINELNRRISLSRGDETLRNDHYSRLAQSIVSVVACRGPEEVPRVLAFSRRNDSFGVLSAYARASRLAGQTANVFELARHVSSEHLSGEVLASLCSEGLGPSSIVGLQGKGHPVLVCLELVKGATAPRVRTHRDVSRLFPRLTGHPERVYEGTTGLLHEGFFAALAAGLAGRAAKGWMKTPPKAEGLWLTEAVRAFEALADEVGRVWRAEQRWMDLGEIYAAFPLAVPDRRSFDDNRRFIAVRLALRDIAFDLSTIGLAVDAKGQIKVDAMARARSHPFWHDEIWIATAVERRISIHSPDAASILIEAVSKKTGGVVSEFMERTDLYAQLAMFAVDNDLEALARRTLQTAVDCMLGYGWRKDLFAMEVLDSLSLLASRGRAEAAQRILELSGPFTQITEYTDGDETNHVRTDFYEALAIHFPDRVPACYASLLAEAEWRYAEGLTIAFAGRADLETAPGQALLETYLPMNETARLESFDPEVRPMAHAALATVERRTGRVRPAAGRERHPNSSTGIEEGDPADLPDPAQYPPELLADFVKSLRAVKGFDIKQGQVACWLQHWEAAGQGEAALASFETVITQRHLGYELQEALDIAFDIALRVRGRTKALPLLVQAHIRRYGWQRWYTSSEEAEGRLRKFAQNYPGQWRDYIRATAVGETGPGGPGAAVVIGQSRLVTFLVEVGELDEAWLCAKAMARIFEEELSAQPIVTPAWAE
mgnify:CR=1 FL=1